MTWAANGRVVAAAVGYEALMNIGRIVREVEAVPEFEPEPREEPAPEPAPEPRPEPVGRPAERDG